MLEAVVNVSEGRRADVLTDLRDACGNALLDVHVDPDHDRSVFTVASRTSGGTERAVRGLARAVLDGPFDLASSRGFHPRLGVLDVVPFVALGRDHADSVRAARSFGEWWAATGDVPVFFYDAADPAGRTLPTTRRDAFGTRPPDAGPSAPHARLGTTAVGARAPMVAINCELDRDDLALARRVARAVRERDGGLEGVRALGFPLTSRGRVQVSMNLVDLDATGLETAVSAVRAHLRENGADVERVETVGLVPADELARCSPEFRSWSGVGAERTIEAAMARAGRGDEPAGRGGA